MFYAFIYVQKHISKIANGLKIARRSCITRKICKNDTLLQAVDFPWLSRGRRIVVEHFLQKAWKQDKK